MSTAAVLRGIVTLEGATKTEAQLSSLGANIKKLGSSGTFAFAALGTAAISFAAVSVKAYMTHQAALSQLQNAMKRSPQLIGASVKAFEDQAQVIQRLTGANHDAVIAGDTVLAQFNLTQKQIQDLVPLVEDLATRLGTDVPTAAAAVGRALLGNTRGLKAVGIQFKATGDRARDVNTIIQDLTQHVGGAGVAFGQTATGQLKIFQAEVKNLEEDIGAGLVPVLQGAVENLIPIMDQIDKLGKSKVGQVLFGFASPMPIALPRAIPHVDLRDLNKWRDIGDVMYADWQATHHFSDALAAMTAELKASALAAMADVAAQDQLAGGFLAVQGAALSVTQSQYGIRDAQAKVNQDLKDGHKRTLQYKEDLLGLQQAQLGAVQSQQNLATTILGYVQAQVGAGASTDSVVAKVKAYGRQVGLTKSQVDALATSVLTLIGKDKELPQNKPTKYSTPGLASAIINVENYEAILSHLQGMDPIVTHLVTQTSFAGWKPSATGGVIPGFAGGALITKPTVMPFRTGLRQLGEGGYSTPFGTGAEGIVPLNDATMDRLGKAIARHMAADIVINVRAEMDSYEIGRALERRRVRLSGGR